MKRRPRKESSDLYIFTIPEDDELFTHARENVVLVLPKPSGTGQKGCREHKIMLPVDLSDYKLEKTGFKCDCKRQSWTIAVL